MFFHILKYKLKCLMRDKVAVFWVLMLPIILITLFNFTLTNILAPDEFTQVKIAVVDNNDFHQNETFKTFVNSLIDSYEKNEQSMFNFIMSSSQKAEKSLDDNEIDGYIKTSEEITLFVKQEGVKQSIVKALLDESIQMNSTVETITSSNPHVFDDKFIEDISNTQNYLKDVPLNIGDFNPIVIMFYSLIAISCMYGAFWGLRVIIENQADLSAQGTRLNLSPVHKLKVLAGDFSAACIIQFTIVLVQILFIELILKKDLGVQMGYIILTTFIASIMGISFGAFIGAIVKKDEDSKIGIVNLVIGAGYVLIASGQVKYNVNSRFPFLAYINPLNLINDSLYSLNYFNSYSRYLTNILLMLLFTFLFSLVTYLIVRREKYESI